MNHDKGTIRVRISISREDYGFEHVYSLLQGRSEHEQRTVLKRALFELNERLLSPNTNDSATTPEQSRTGSNRTKQTMSQPQLSTQNQHQNLPKSEALSLSTVVNKGQESEAQRKGGFVFTGSNMYSKDELI